MKKVLIALCAAALVFSTVSCLNIHINGGRGIACKGPVVEKSFDLNGFNEINVKGSADIFLSQGDAYAVRVNANEEVFEHLNYHVDGNVLILETVNNVNLRAETFDVYITLPCLESLMVNGAADVKMDGPYISDKDFIVNVNGAGDFALNGISVPTLGITINGAGDIVARELRLGHLNISINGAGDVTVAGEAESANFSVAGAGDIDARNLDCENISTHKAGVASIRLKK